MKFFGGLILAAGLVAALLGVIVWLLDMPSVDEIFCVMFDYLTENPKIVALYGLAVALVGATILNEGI